jgi:excisionase family DNA binding protein
MQPIQNNLSLDTATVEGLDNLFEDDTGHVMPVTSDGMATLDITADTIDTWTLAEASEELNVSKRTILRKLKLGDLRGYKVVGSNGPEWRIYPIDTQDVTPSPAKISVNSVTGHNQSVSATHDTSIDITLVRELMFKIENLTYRNGYLEAQLSEKTEQIKLLTDSQPKDGWWNRFRTWVQVRSPKPL